MIVLGIDPGFERIGYGAVAREGSRLAMVEHGLITTLKGPLPDRLVQVHEQIGGLIERIRPDALAIERLLFSVNRKTAIDVAKALGCILLAGSQKGYVWSEYAPSEIKLAVVGNGSAEKKQVEYMVMKLLSLRDAPKPDDVADALAIALCHALRGDALRR